MNLSRSASAIGLYAYRQNDPGASLYARFYSLVIDQLTRLGVEPTYIGVDGEGYSEKLVEFGGREHKKVLNANFEDITGLSVVANPLGSNAPAFDSYFYSTVSFIESMRQLDLCFTINESFLPFGTEAFDEALRELVELHPWDFGIGFCDAVDRDPELHILGASNGKLSKEEDAALNAWYSSPADVRLQRLRSIYPYNFVNEHQLAQEVQNGMSLKRLIRELPVGTLESLGQNGMYLWKVPDESERTSLRAQLAERSLLIS